MRDRLFGGAQMQLNRFPDIPSFLELVRTRPGMWIGKASIRSLWHMFHGIWFAEDLYGIPDDARWGGFDFDAFEAWVDKTYNVQRLSACSFPLAAMIAGSDDHGFSLWFEWYDRFRAEQRAGPPTRGEDAV
jgi:hypothetical protein